LFVLLFVVVLSVVGLLLFEGVKLGGSHLLCKVDGRADGLQTRLHLLRALRALFEKGFAIAWRMRRGRRSV